MKRYLVIFFIILLIILLAITSTLAVVFFVQSNNASTELKTTREELELVKRKLEENTTSEENPTNTPTGLVTPMPTKNPCLNSSADGRIVVTKPCDNQIITSPLNIKGSATGLFEATMIVEIYDAANNLLHREVVTVGSGEEPGSAATFDEVFNWTPPTLPVNGKIRFYEQSAQDGLPLHFVEIAVKLS